MAATDTSLYESILINSAILLPSDKGMAAMQFLPAGYSDDQATRLSKISGYVKEHELDGLAITLSQVGAVDSAELVSQIKWNKVFEAITKADAKKACALLKAMQPDDDLARALLSIHTLEYINNLLNYCCEAQSQDSVIKISGDIIISAGCFEAIIQELITLIKTRHRIHFSCGLPSHHAYADKPSGFCLLNKIAILNAYDYLCFGDDFDTVILGLDVNRDDGLDAILRHKDKAYTHIDIFDSSVYPYHSLDSMSEFKKPEKDKTSWCCWQRKSGRYFAYDLYQHARNTRSKIHPAIEFSITQLTKSIEKSQANERQVMLYLPLGWDSHEGERAGCSALRTKTSNRYKYRFTDKDMQYFYSHLKSLCDNYQDTLMAVTIHLEGGYTDSVNQNQIDSIINFLLKPTQTLSRKRDNDAFFSSSSSKATHPPPSTKPKRHK